MKQSGKLVVTALLVLQLASPALAQFDDFDNDFAPPPPPPPGGSSEDPFGATSSPSDFGATSSRGSNANTNSSAAGTAGVLSKAKKDKLAKSNIEDITNENFPETIESFDFPDAELTDVVKAISELTGKNFIIDNGIRGKITIIAPSKITVAEAYKAFLSALAINGFAVVPSGAFYKIRSSRNAQRDSIETYAGAYYPNSDQMITRIVHLKHISADGIARDLRLLSSKDGEMSPFPQTNSIVISDYGSNIDRVMKIINQLDVPGFDDQLEVIPVKYAKAKDIAELIDKIVNKGDTKNNQRGGAFTAGVPRFTRSTTTNNSQGSAYYMVFPDDRTNSLIVTGNKAGIARIKKLLGQLDFRIRAEDAGGVYVYYVRNGDAEKIAQTLSGIAKDAAPKTSGGGGSQAPSISPVSGVTTTQEIFGGEVKVTADKGTNSLVVVASKQDYEVVKSLLSKLDIARDQVYVESIIMEMTASDALDYQIGYFQYANEGGVATGPKIGFNGMKPTTLSAMLSPQGGSGTILGFGSGKSITLKDASGVATTVKELMGFINFLKTTGNANILSTPQILAMDNQEAMIEVGDKVVTGSQAQGGANGANPVVTPIFDEATISMKIKPFISPTSNTVRMELETKVSQLSAAKTPEAFQSSSQPLAKRSIKTNIVVPNGDTAVLGGLIKDDQVENIQKVPLLGDIPILGWLFKSRNTVVSKTNLLIFMTPKIIRNQADTKNLLSQKLDDRLDYIKSTGGKDPYGKTIDKIQRRAQSQPAEVTE